MRALYFDGKLSLRNVETPRPAPGEALIRVRLAGICGTDRQILKGYSSFHGIPGHEFVGEVVASADQSWLGQRVVGEINVTCGECSFCRRGLIRHCSRRTVMGIVNRDGALAEFVVLPVVNLHEVPKEIPNEAAVFVEPLAAASEILDQMHVAPGTRVAVLGDGRLGLLVAQVLHHAGAQVTVIGRNHWKLELARSWGLATLNASGKALSSGRLGSRSNRDRLRTAPTESFSVVVEATGSPQGLEEALRRVEPRGTVVMKSTFHEPARFDTAKLVVDEVTLLGSRCGNFVTALDLLRGNHVQVQDLVSKTFPLEAGLEAFEYLDQNSCLKVLLAPSSSV